jgi:hypothetical protein
MVDIAAGQDAVISHGVTIDDIGHKTENMMIILFISK